MAHDSRIAEVLIGTEDTKRMLLATWHKEKCKDAVREQGLAEESAIESKWLHAVKIGHT